MSAAVAVGSAVACSATSAPADARAIAIAAPSPRDAPVTSATFPSSRNRSSDMQRAWSAGSRQKLFANGRKDVDEDDLFVEHRRAVLYVRWKVQHVALRRDALLAVDREADAAAFHDRHLLVRMGVHGRHDPRPESQPADHEAIAPDHLPFDPVGNLLDRHIGPVAVLKREDGIAARHFFSDRPLSRPEPMDAKAGCTFTTPYWRSSFSRLAAIIQRKLIAPPGAATFG